MRERTQEIGSRNIVGQNVHRLRNEMGMKQKELLAQLQVRGIEMNGSSLSKLEGQIRSVNDIEIKALADIFNISAETLLGIGE